MRTTPIAVVPSGTSFHSPLASGSGIADGAPSYMAPDITGALIYRFR